MSETLDMRGLTLDEARADMRRVLAASGSHKAAARAVGLPLSTWFSAFCGQYRPGRKVLEKLYGPTGRKLRPELPVREVPTAGAVTPESPESPVVTAQVYSDSAFGGISVAELLLRAQRRAVALENELDEALGEIESLKGMAARLGGPHG